MNKQSDATYLMRQLQSYERMYNHGQLCEMAKQGDATAQCVLGANYCSQNLDDRPIAVKWLKKASKQGHAIAQYWLSTAYVNGEGVSINYVKACRWLQKAAEQGYANAQHALGTMYFSGRGVVQSDIEAVKWYRLAAAQGYEPSQTTLGTIKHITDNLPEQAEYSPIYKDKSSKFSLFGWMKRK